MNVLSLFDGMSCGRIALERAGITVTNYFASEIDKHAIKVSKANWPDVKHIGSVVFVNVTYSNGYTRIYNWLTGEDFTFEGKIDLIIGGSPCQGFSFAGKQLNFNDPRSALFFEFVRLREETYATWFMLENVRMAGASEAVISEYMGVQPHKLNSEVFSAQGRKRLYWTNIPRIYKPEDKGILLRHILEYEVKEDYLLSSKAVDYMGRKVKDGRSHFDFHHHDSRKDKSNTLVANTYKGVPYNVIITEEAISRIARKNYSQPKVYPDKTGTLNSKNNSGCLSIDSGTTLIPVGHYLRRLTEIECERLQSVPDNYTAGVSSTQRYRMLGNGWECNTITHLFQPLLIADIL